MEKKKDETFDFFGKYLFKYVAEIKDFKTEIEINDLDSSIFSGASTIINNPEQYSENEVTKALDIYDPLAFYQACGLVRFEYETKKFLINPTLLAKKVFEGGSVKSEDADKEKYKVVSVYTKKSVK